MVAVPMVMNEEPVPLPCVLAFHPQLVESSVGHAGSIASSSASTMDMVTPPDDRPTTGGPTARQVMPKGSGHCDA